MREKLVLGVIGGPTRYRSHDLSYRSELSRKYLGDEDARGQPDHWRERMRFAARRFRSR